MDITPELGAGTASGITVIDGTDANVLVACNRSGDIYRSEDRGDDWTHQNIAASFNAIHSRGSKLIAVGAAGAVWKSSNQGVTWVAGDSFSAVALNAVWMTSGSVAYACGAAGTILKTTTSGLTWTALTTGVATNLTGIHFFNKRYGFAVGASGTVIQTSDAGASWAPISGITDDVDCVLMLDVRELDFNGFTDCSANPNYPAGVVGDDYYVTVAGRIGGAAGKVVEIGDVYRCTVINAGGTEAAVGASWQRILRSTVGDVVMFSRNGITTRRWLWDGVTLKDQAAGPEVATGRLSMCGIICNEGSEKYVTQADGCVAAPYGLTGDYNVYFFGSNGPITDTTNTAQHQNRSGDLSGYTVSTKSWGDASISATLTTVSDQGYQRPCIKAELTWTHGSDTPTSQPTPATSPATGYLPTAGAWVICELNGGPQVTLNPGEWFEGAYLTTSAKRIAIGPHTTTLVSVISSVGGTISGGTWTITVNGETTPELQWDASIQDVEDALSALSTVDGNVSVTGLDITATNNTCKFAFNWTDSVVRTVTVYRNLLTGTTTTHSITNTFNHNYTLIPIVIRDGVVYGPYYLSRSGFTRANDRVDPCWQYLGTGPDCSYASETQTLGTYNHLIHSKYREFLEAPTAWPSGADLSKCMEYCRPEDFFGEWEDATIQRVIPVFHNENGTPVTALEADDWVPTTLDFSEGEFTVGWAIGVMSDLAGSWSMELLIDNICLSWSVREPIPECGGTLICDEPMSVSVPAWLQANMEHDPFSGNCSSSESYFGANWRIEDGWLVTDHVNDTPTTSIPIDDFVGVAPYYWRERIYAGGSLRKHDLFTRQQTEDFCLTVECELQRIHEEDATILPEDVPNHSSHGTSLDLNLRRPEEDFGIFIGGLCKFGVHRNAHIYGQSTDNHVCGRSWYYLTVDGRVETHGALIDACGPPGHGTYECIDIDEIGYHAVPFAGMRVSTRVWNSPTERTVPLKNDILRLEVTWAGLEPTVFDCYAYLRYNVRAYLNNQLQTRMTGFTSNGNQFPVNIGDPRQTAWWEQENSFGVYAHRGGKFRNFKAWLRT